MASMTTDVTFERRPYRGGCHCGNIRYVAYLTLPDPSSPAPHVQTFKKQSGLWIYKCNCTVCHKMSIFHLRLRSAPDDFLLLSPLEPSAADSGMTSYQCNSRHSHWYFCATCGVRCFTIRKDGETVEEDVPGEGLRKVWRPKKEGWKEEGEDASNYFSLNAATLDVQEGLDLRSLHVNGWIEYVDSLDSVEETAGRPHRGGMY